MASLQLFFPILAAHGVQSCQSTQELRLVRICKKKKEKKKRGRDWPISIYCFAVSSLQLCSVLFSSMHFLLPDWCGALLPGLKQELLSSSYSLPRSTSPQMALGCSYKCYGEAGQATREHLSPHHRNSHRFQTSNQTKCSRRLIVQHCLLLQQWRLAQMVMVNLQNLQSIHNDIARFFTKPKRYEHTTPVFWLKKTCHPFHERTYTSSIFNVPQPNGSVTGSPCYRAVPAIMAERILQSCLSLFSLCFGTVGLPFRGCSNNTRAAGTRGHHTRPVGNVFQ